MQHSLQNQGRRRNGIRGNCNRRTDYIKCSGQARPVVGVENANPFAGTLTPIIDANLTGTAWYMFTAPGMAETFIYGYLDGHEGPRFETRTNFMSDGVDFKSALDFGVGAVDYRGTYKNVGA